MPICVKANLRILRQCHDVLFTQRAVNLQTDRKAFIFVRSLQELQLIR